jgi:uncharacterized membrane protein YphA (DoxX/SURF4 family)
MTEVRVMKVYNAGANQESTVDDRNGESRGKLTHLVHRLVANRYAVLGMRWTLAGVFLLSAAGKLVDIKRYSIGAVMEFGILPTPLAHIFGMVLPFVELMCAFGLLFGVATRLSSFGIALMSTTFFIVKGVILWHGGDVVCGCFGAIVTTLVSLTIFMDPPILLLSLAVMLSPRSSRSWVSLGNRLRARRKERAPASGWAINVKTYGDTWGKQKKLQEGENGLKIHCYAINDYVELLIIDIWRGGSHREGMSYYCEHR